MLMSSDAISDLQTAILADGKRWLMTEEPASAAQLISKIWMSTLLNASDQANESVLAKVEDQCAYALEYTPMGPGLHDGLSGVALAIECAYRAGQRFSEHREALKPLHSELAALGMRSRLGNCDLISGAAGIGLSLSTIRPESPELVAGIVENILSVVDFSSTQPLWILDESSRRGQGGQDLGIAHGVPGLMLVLVRLRCGAEASVVEKIDTFLRNAANWLGGCVNTRETESLFPYLSGHEKGSRLAWCYGDLSVGYALLVSGSCASDNKAIGLGRAAVERAMTRPIEESGVSDAFLCHGTCGLLALMESINLVDRELIPRSYSDLWKAILAEQAKASLATGALSGFDLLDGWTGVGLFLSQAGGRLPGGWRSTMLLQG